MSIIGCILIVAFANKWQSVFVFAFVFGLLGSTMVGLSHFEISGYDRSSFLGYMVFYVGLGTAAFTAETAALFAIKLGLRTLYINWRRK